MRKVGIITLNGYFNYGNRLQNYALERVLRSFDCDTSTIKVQNIDASTSKDTVLYRLQRIVRKDKGEILDKLQRKTRNIIHKTEIKESTRIRTEIFKDFTKKHIRETDLTISNGDINKDIIEQYDFFVAGSDQVWNPYYVQGSSTYFLDFAPKEKRISYAASFGVATLPEEYKENYREFIINILHLSVREEAAAKIIKDLTGKDALVHVDPTMLLTKDQWLGISKKASNKPDSEYLLTYFLGGIPKEHERRIKQIAQSKDLTIVNLGDIREKDTYRTGPSEFIDYINDCSILCTDSFHGAVFSILLEKPFVVYDRVGSTSMYSRIDTLLDKFDLTTRKAESISTLNDLFNIDFSHVPPILEMERNKSFDYLKNALKIRDDKTHES